MADQGTHDDTPATPSAPPLGTLTRTTVINSERDPSNDPAPPEVIIHAPDTASDHGSAQPSDAAERPASDAQNGAITPVAKTNTRLTVEKSPQHSSPPWGALRQMWWSWTVAAVAMAVYVLTVCYAFGNTSLRYLQFASLDPTNTLLVLRVLSEVTSGLLGALVYLCSDRALWTLIVRADGAHLGSLLALGPGSGPWAWINLVCRNIRGGRSLAWVRVTTALILPAMSVILLSRVSIRQRFDVQAPFLIAGGVGNFNAGFADDYAVYAATFMSSDFSSLLQTGEAAWPVPVLSRGTEVCDGTEIFSAKTCGQGYFLHGGIKMITPWPTKNSSTPDAPIYSAHMLSGLQLDFTALEPGARFQGDLDCIVVGDRNSALQICLAQFANNSLSAKYVHCPLSLIGECLENKSWLSSSGWSTQLTAYSRQATVHFFRSNLSAVAVTELTNPVPHRLDAAGMLSVFNTSLTATTGLGAQVSAAGQFVSFVATYLMLAETSSPTAAQALTKLYNLLAMPLYYFQPTFMSPYTRVPSPNRVLDGLPTDEGLYTTASFSTTYFGIQLAAWTIWTYTVVLALLLTACITVLVLGSLPRWAGRIPESSPWRVLDLVEQCEVKACTTSADAKPSAGGEGCQDGSDASQVHSGDEWQHARRVLRDARVKLRKTS